MTIKHFCHVCNVNFHRAVDFIQHSHIKNTKQSQQDKMILETSGNGYPCDCGCKERILENRLKK
jgi:hypothetical protein